MSILILNSVAHARSPYEEYLKQLDEDLILLSQENYVADFPKEKYVHIESFKDYDENGYVDLRAIELYEQYGYHTVLSSYEYDVLRAAKIRDTLQLPGQKLASALMYRNKFLMKEAVRSKGIHTPSFQLLTTPLDLLEFIKEHGYPVVVKPISGAGSVETFVLKNRDDLINMMSPSFPENMMVESFVDGEIYHVDGMVIDGKVEFICTSKYLNPLINYQPGAFTGGYLLHPKDSLSARMAKQTQQVLEALDTPANTAFHAEWFHTPNDEIIFCEIACRVGGGRINETIKYTFGVDLYQAHIQSQVGIPQSFPTADELQNVDSLTGRILMLKKEGRFRSSLKKALPSWVVHHELHAQSGDTIDSPVHCVDLLAGFVVKGMTEQDVHEKLHAITDWFNESVQWE